MPDDAAVALVSDDPSERGWYHTRMARLDFATRSVDDALHRIALAAALAGRIAFGQARRLPRRLVERPRPRRERDQHPRPRDRQGDDRSTPPKPPTSPPSSGATRRASGSPAGRRSARSTASSASTAESLWSRYEDAVIGTNSFSAQISPRPTRPASPRCARRSASRRRSCSRPLVGCGLEAGHEAERRRSPATSTTTRTFARCGGRAATAWSSTASSSCRKTATARCRRSSTSTAVRAGRRNTPSIPATRCPSPPPATRSSCRTIAAIPAGARISRGSISAIRAAPSSRTFWPASSAASPKASPTATASASPASAMAAT